MTLKVTSIDELDPELVSQAQAEFTQLLQERYPEVELSRGVIHDIIAFLSGGVSGGVNQTEINRVLDSRSLQQIQAQPTLADDELVDHVLSNYLVTRKTGTRASGDITIVVEDDATVVVSANALYVANGLNFRIDTPIVARPSGTPISTPTERALTPRGDGTFEFSAPATAEVIGSVANIRSGTKFTPDPIPARFVTAYAGGDFTGGTETETNADFVSRLIEGIPAKVTAGRNNLVALIKDQAAFADTRDYSIIGYGDPEMIRDQHSIFPISYGGRVDIYSQTDAMPRTVEVTKTCTLVAIQGDSSLWQVGVSRDDAPGFYMISSVRRPADPSELVGFAVTSDVRGWDFGDDIWKPDITNIDESAYTRYQTAVIQFLDTETDVSELTLGDTREYVLSAVAQPLIRELQEFVASRDQRYLAADLLVRAAVPCFVSISGDIVKDATESSPVVDDITNAIADFINSQGFTEAIYASEIAEVVAPFLSGRQALAPLVLHGLIRRLDGTTTTVHDSQVLRMPSSPSTFVTPRTTIFILDPADVGLSVVNRES